MNFGIFNVHADVNAFDCTRGCTDTVRESALKVDLGRKIPCRTGESNWRRQRAGPMLYRLSCIPTCQPQVTSPCSNGAVTQCCLAYSAHAVTWHHPLRCCYAIKPCLYLVHAWNCSGRGFFLAYENFGTMFDNSFSSCVCFFLIFLK